MVTHVMRKHQKWLMIVISVLVIISFVWLYSTRGTKAMREYEKAQVVGTIYNQTIKQSDLVRLQQIVQYAFMLGLPNITKAEFSRDPNFVLNYYVIQHEAPKLGIDPDEKQIEEAIRALQPFQLPGGGFDSNKYANFLAAAQSRGVNARDLEGLIKTDIQLGQLHQLTDATVVQSPEEIKVSYELLNRRLEGQVIRLYTADYERNVQVTDEQIQQYANEHKEILEDPEHRVISFVEFKLTPEQEKLQNSERVDAIQKLADSVEQFSQQVAQAKASGEKIDFKKLAEANHLQVKTTSAFTKVNAEQELKAQNLGPDLVNQFVTASFQLNENSSTTDPLPNSSNNAFYVLHLDQIIPAKPISLDEAKPKIVSILKSELAKGELATKANEIRNALVADLSQGKNLESAAQTAAVKVEDIPSYSVMERQLGSEPNLPNGPIILDKLEQMPAKELSEFIPTEDGGLFVFLEGYQPIDMSKYEAERSEFTKQRFASKKQIYFYEWLRENRESAGVKIKSPNGRRAPGQEENQDGQT